MFKSRFLLPLCDGPTDRPINHQTWHATRLLHFRLALLACCLDRTPGKNGSTGQLFLQQAETVRLISPATSRDGEEGVETRGGLEAVETWQPLSVTDIEGGETVLLREISRGTHVGRAIDAMVTES